MHWCGLKMEKKQQQTFNICGSMPLILGAGTGGRRIIINLWQDRHSEERSRIEQTLNTVCKDDGCIDQVVPVLL